MPSVNLDVEYRPLRVGFLVRHNEIDDIVKAASINSLLWGGINNPLIPVSEDISLARDLVEQFQVDVLHPIVDDPQLMFLFEEYPYLDWPKGIGGPALIQDFEDEVRLTALNVFPLINKYWREHFRFDGESGCVIPRWDEGDKLSNLFAVLFGKYPSNIEKRLDFPQTYVNGLRAQEINIDITSSIPDVLATNITPITLTRRELDFYRTEIPIGPGIYVGSIDEPPDVINFWNLRASGESVRFCTLEEFERFEPYLRAFLQNIAKGFHEDILSRDKVVIWTRDENQIPEEIISLIPEGLRFFRSSLETIFLRPAIYNFKRQTVLASLDLSPTRPPKISFLLPQPPFADDLLEYFTPQQFVVSIRPLTEYEYKGHTLSLPILPDLNEWFSRQIMFGPSELRMDSKGLNLIIDTTIKTLTLHPIQIQELTRRVIERAGLEIQPSKPGIIAHRIIDQLGGLNNSRVFMIRGVRRLIAHKGAMKKGVTRSLAKLYILDKDSTSGDAYFEKFENLHIQKREKPKLTNDEVFDYLLAKEIFRPGLLIKCENCTANLWLGIDSIRELCVCDFCGKEFSISQLLRDRGDWKFRLSGLFSNEDKQGGAIPVILTLFQIEFELRSATQLLYENSCNLKGQGVTCETDLIALVPGENMRPQVLIGECKSEGTEIDENDVNNLIEVQKIIEGSGIKCFLIFSKTAERFSDKELGYFNKPSDLGIPVILFTSKELESLGPYRDLEEVPGIPHRYVRSLQDMADNSAWIYLKDCE